MRKAEAAGMKNAYAELMARKLQWMLEMGKGREAVREGAEISAAGSLPLGKEWILLEYVGLKCLLFCGAFGEAGRLAGKLAEADEGWADPKALEVSESGARQSGSARRWRMGVRAGEKMRIFPSAGATARKSGISGQPDRY